MELNMAMTRQQQDYMWQLPRTYTWQYNGVAPWYEIVKWCDTNLKTCWNNGYEIIHFGDKGEYAWFLLRWAWWIESFATHNFSTKSHDGKYTLVSPEKEAIGPMCGSGVGTHLGIPVPIPKLGSGAIGIITVAGSIFITKVVLQCINWSGYEELGHNNKNRQGR